MSEKARRFAVLGDPVAHSKSPKMHGAAYKALGLPHTYEAIRATPEDLGPLVKALREGTYGGFNVTVPHKRRILEHVDALDRSATIAGAANTLARRHDGSIVGYNTDTRALAEEIAGLAPERAGVWKDASALVLGSGGAARSAVVALAVELAVARVVVRGRTFGDPEARAAFVRDAKAMLASARPDAEIIAEPWEPSDETERALTVVVQATSAGMHGADPGEPIAAKVAWSDLPPRAVALDVIYAPPETPFLVAAKAHGIRCANGFGMLARQGALAFELWLGIPAPYNAMLSALL